MTTKRKSNFRDKITKDSQRQQKAATSYGHLNLPKGVKVWSPKPGSKGVLLDFLPYEVTDPKHPDRDPERDIAMPGTLWYKLPYKTHRNIGADNDTVVCLTSIKKPCPVCEEKAKLVKQQAPKADIKALNASRRNLYVVAPLNDKDAEVEPHIFDMSQFLFQDLLNEELEDNPDNAIFPDLEEGKTLRVRFDATTIENSKPFATADRIDFIERQEQWDESILKKVPNLDEVLVIMSYDELKAKFFEMENEEDAGELKEAETDVEVPQRRKRIVEEEETPPRREVSKSRKAEPEQEEEKPSRRMERTNPPKKEEEKPTRTRREPAKNEDERCPFGHKFGVDIDEFKDCEKCDVWDDCGDEKDKKK